VSEAFEPDHARQPVRPEASDVLEADAIDWQTGTHSPQSAAAGLNDASSLLPPKKMAVCRQVLSNAAA
jgi:hypothetical protein